MRTASLPMATWPRGLTMRWAASRGGDVGSFGWPVADAGGGHGPRGGLLLMITPTDD